MGRISSALVPVSFLVLLLAGSDAYTAGLVIGLTFPLWLGWAVLVVIASKWPWHAGVAMLGAALLVGLPLSLKLGAGLGKLVLLVIFVALPAISGEAFRRAGILLESVRHADRL